MQNQLSIKHTVHIQVKQISLCEILQKGIYMVAKL